MNPSSPLLGILQRLSNKEKSTLWKCAYFYKICHNSADTVSNLMMHNTYWVSVGDLGTMVDGCIQVSLTVWRLTTSWNCVLTKDQISVSNVKTVVHKVNELQHCPFQQQGARTWKNLLCLQSVSMHLIRCVLCVMYEPRHCCVSSKMSVWLLTAVQQTCYLKLNSHFSAWTNSKYSYWEQIDCFCLL